MPQAVRDVMSGDPVTVDAMATVADAAEAMRDHDIGAVVVRSDGVVRGILTDRDIVVRAVADRRNPEAVRVKDVCSTEQLATAGPDEPVEQVIQAMRAKGIRRVPVVDGDQPVGIVSLGDLAVERDEGAALGEISAALPNR